MRLLLRRGLRRRQDATSGGSSSTSEQWENTRSCPGSLKCHRRGETPHHPSAAPAANNALRCGLQRHNSDPGSLKSRSPSPVAAAFFKRQHTVDSLAGSVAIDIHAESRWSLYKPSAHWDEVFEPGRDSHLHHDAADEQNFNLKHLLNTGRPRSRLRCLALLFALVYLAYAFYVTISRVNRSPCKPIAKANTPALTPTAGRLTNATD